MVQYDRLGLNRDYRFETTEAWSYLSFGKLKDAIYTCSRKVDKGLQTKSRTAGTLRRRGGKTIKYEVAVYYGASRVDRSRDLAVNMILNVVKID